MSEQNLPKLKVLPFGTSDWPDLRLKNKFFIDKTAKLRDLVTIYDKVFISRPRRMGKSMLISMLEDLFTNGDKNFKDTAIYGNWPEADCFPVINFSFINVEGNDVKSFTASLQNSLVEAYDHIGFTEVNQFKQEAESFDSFLKKLSNLSKTKRLVFLIDEWDYPLSSNLHDQKAFNDILSVLRVFYNWFRTLKNVRFALITGIMRYNSASLFTGLDIQDISMLPGWADLIGCTQEELVTGYAPYITAASELIGCSAAQLIADLKEYYDGFCFDNQASLHIYCPYALNKFFEPLIAPATPNWVPEFKSYWMTNVDTTEALKTYLRSRPFNLEVDYPKLLSNTVTLTETECTKSVSFAQVQILPLLTQAGYLTIKGLVPATDRNTKSAPDLNRQLPAFIKKTTEPEFRLGFPNIDVSSNFMDIVNDFINDNINTLSNNSEAKAKLRQALEENNIGTACHYLNVLICGILFDAFTDAHEAFYRTVFGMWLRDIFNIVREETPNYKGRSDLEITTHQDQVIVFELKLIDDLEAKNVVYDEAQFEAIKDSVLEPARLQVKDRGYGVNYYTDGRPVLGALLAISAQERRIVAWREFNPNPHVGVREGLCTPVDLSNKNTPLAPPAKTNSTRQRATRGSKTAPRTAATSKAAAHTAATSTAAAHTATTSKATVHTAANCKAAVRKAPRARPSAAQASKDRPSTKAKRSAASNTSSGRTTAARAAPQAESSSPAQGKKSKTSAKRPAPKD